MADISVPRTPTPQFNVHGRPLAAMTPSSKEDEILGDQICNGTLTPPILPNLSLTPPPSSQAPKVSTLFTLNDTNDVDQTAIASPYTAIENMFSKQQTTTVESLLLTAEQVQGMHESDLRDLVFRLLPALGEARMSCAHAKLQHSLLSIETTEAAQRAVVEHDMTRREVEVLQTVSPILRSRVPNSAEIKSPYVSAHQVELNLKQARSLENMNARLEHRLKQAKKIIKHLDGKNTHLMEDNFALRQRIKQNREHIEAMQSSGIISAGAAFKSMPTFSSHRGMSKPSNNSQVGGHDPFGALLFAGAVLNAEPASVPATPTNRPRQLRFHPGHSRGTHSLSSLPVTPSRSRPLTADNTLHTPTNRTIPASHLSYSAPNALLAAREYERCNEERDSTISASETEEAYTDDDIPVSQASQIATRMLRLPSGLVLSDTRVPSMDSKEELLKKKKLSNKVIKSSSNTSREQQRKAGSSSRQGEEKRASKKAKFGPLNQEHLGLGIGMWPTPS
ncbi:hypothetical protein MMC14_010720 [Varicellaria rhodocarpa]|nr:hypothetical protein [Varicellaria rhodocarpa]